MHYASGPSESGRPLSSGSAFRYYYYYGRACGVDDSHCVARVTDSRAHDVADPGVTLLDGGYEPLEPEATALLLLPRECLRARRSGDGFGRDLRGAARGEDAHAQSEECHVATGDLAGIWTF